jgi:hypothetical protein
VRALIASGQSDTSQKHNASKDIHHDITADQSEPAAEKSPRSSSGMARKGNRKNVASPAGSPQGEENQ